MALGFGDTSFQPYSPDELLQLEGLLGGPPEPAGLGAPMAPEPPMPPPVAPTAPAPAEPIVPPVAAAPVMPPPPEPLDTGFPSAAPPPRGLPLAGVSYSGVPEAERQKLGSLYGQLAENRYDTIDRAAETEGGIQQKRIAAADKKIGAANVAANKAEMALAGQQAARAKLQKEGEEWSLKKDDPSKTFEGAEWAGILGVLGVAAGAFTQAMGWSNGNPALQMFDSAVNGTVAAQREQKASRLQEIRARIGDAQAAEQILSAQLHDAIADRAAAEQERATSQEAFDRLGSLVDAERAKVQEMILGAYERMVPKEEKQFARPQATGGGKSLIEQMQDLTQLDKALEERGYDQENPVRKAINQQLSTFAGSAKPSGGRDSTGIQYERDKAEFQNQPQVQAAVDGIDALAKEGLLVDDGKGGYKVGPKVSKAFDPGAGEFAPSVQRFFGLSTPVQDRFDAVVESFAKATGVTPVKAAELLGGNTIAREQLASRLTEAKRMLRAQQPPGKRGGATLEGAGFRRKAP